MAQTIWVRRSFQYGSRRCRLNSFPAGSPVVTCDPERVRTRAHDLVATSQEFLEAGWANAAAGNAVNQLLEYSVAGSTMVFGPLGGNDSTVAVFAFRVPATIIFLSLQKYSKLDK